MATYLYCIHAEAAGVPAALAGIDGAPVRAIDVSSLEAWVSDVREIPVTVSIDRMRAHDAVCAAALALAQTPLPIRFGQAFASDEDAKVAIAAKAPQLSSRLRRVSGCVELRVVAPRAVESHSSATGAEVATDEDAIEGDRPGTAFLRRLAGEGREDRSREVACEKARQKLRIEALGLIVDDRRCEAARGVFYYALLVRRRDVDTVREIATRMLSSQPSQTLVMGPFAPYSFAGDA